MYKIYFLIFFFSLSLQTTGTYQSSDWINNSRIFFLKLNPTILYPTILEDSAISGSIKDIRLLAKMWLLIQDAILIGKLEVSTENIVDYNKKSEEYAIKWFELGAIQNDGLCNYHLSLIYRFREESNIENSDKYAKKCVEILESKLPSVSSEEYLALMNCYGNGWGVNKNYEISKKLYNYYIQQCNNENIKPINWNMLNYHK